MPNIASVLKEEIARVARKAVRGETTGLKKSSSHYRTDIAALKRRIATLEKQLTRLSRASGRGRAAAPVEEDARSKMRFSSKGLLSKRQKLGLSAAEAGAIMGVSGQSVYKWEQGKARPRVSQMGAISDLRKLNKKQARARLEQLAH